MDNKIAQRIFQQIMDLWITHEIEKRKRYKKISFEFKLCRLVTYYTSLRV